MRLLVILLLATCNMAFAQTGKVNIYRWNHGYRAENIPIAQAELSQEDFKSFITGKSVPPNFAQTMYRGCFLVSYEAKDRERVLASHNPAPKYELHKLCINNQGHK